MVDTLPVALHVCIFEWVDAQTLFAGVPLACSSFRRVCLESDEHLWRRRCVALWEGKVESSWYWQVSEVQSALWRRFATDAMLGWGRKYVASLNIIEKCGLVGAPSGMRVVEGYPHFFKVCVARLPPDFALRLAVGPGMLEEKGIFVEEKGIFVTSAPKDTRLLRLCPWIARGDKVVAIDDIPLHNLHCGDAVELMKKRLESPRDGKPCATLLTFAARAEPQGMRMWTDADAAVDQARVAPSILAQRKF